MQGYIVLFSILVTCDLVIEKSFISIPGSILGLVFLFIYFLFLKKVPQCLEEASGTLLKHLPLFLVPVGVAVKDLIQNIDNNLLVMLGVSITALIIAFFMTIFILSLSKKALKNKEQQNSQYAK